MGQSHFGGVNHVVKISMVVGMRIFSIVGGLSFAGDLSRGYGLWPPLGRDRLLLRRLRRREEVRVRMRS